MPALIYSFDSPFRSEAYKELGAKAHRGTRLGICGGSGKKLPSTGGQVFLRLGAVSKALSPLALRANQRM